MSNAFCMAYISAAEVPLIANNLGLNVLLLMLFVM